MRRAAMLAAAMLAAAMLAGAPVAAEVAEPAGYRGSPYRAPVPKALAGALVIDDAAAHALWWSGAVRFVDVLPRPPKPGNLPEGTIWRDPPHPTIPGAIWLPNTGFDALDPATEAYFTGSLDAALGGDRSAPVVIFCKAECWMSWNAAKRALEHGFERVFWYPDGVDGWAAAGRELAPVEPHGGGVPPVE